MMSWQSIVDYGDSLVTGMASSSVGGNYYSFQYESFIFLVTVDSVEQIIIYAKLMKIVSFYF